MVEGESGARTEVVLGHHGPEAARARSTCVAEPSLVMTPCERRGAGGAGEHGTAALNRLPRKLTGRSFVFRRVAGPLAWLCCTVMVARRRSIPLEVSLLAASRTALWSAAHEERAALADDLAALSDADWTRPSLCGRWTVEEVVAHLTAAASTGPLRWFASVMGARFDFDVHNDRRLAEHRGATPVETLERFRRVIASTTSAPGPTAAWLGEVVVHAQDVRRPLGLPHAPPMHVVTEVGRFYARRDFTVTGRSTITGLRVEASDGPFTAGAGPLVTGTTLSLTMAMAGRVAYCDDLSGPGLPTLRQRLSPA